MTDTNKCNLLADHDFAWDLHINFITCSKCDAIFYAAPNTSEEM